MGVSEPVPALILGEGNTALGALRALGRQGTPCYVVPATDYVARSRWYRPWPGTHRSDAEPGAEALVDLLASSGVESAVLVPGSDPWVLAIAELPPSLARRFPSSVAPRASLEAFADKGTFADWLARLEIPHPRTVRIRTGREMGTLSEDLLARSFLKPTDSYGFQRRFGRKALRFGSAAEARQQASEALDAGFEVMIQEYVPGPPGAHYFVDGFVDRAGCVRALFARRRLRMWPPDFGNSSAMVSVTREEVRPALDALGTLLREVGYRGIFSAEFKRDPRDGLFRILEVNARVWKFVDFAAGCGVDVCSMAWRDALGLPVETVSSYRVGATCMDAYFDRRPCLDGYRRGEIGLAAWARFWLTSRKVTFAWDDPRPALRWLGAHLRAVR